MRLFILLFAAWRVVPQHLLEPSPAAPLPDPLLLRRHRYRCLHAGRGGGLGQDVRVSAMGAFCLIIIHVFLGLVSVRKLWTKFSE